MESNSSDHRKRSKEQEQQKRRNQGHRHATPRSGGPLFGEVIEKKDGDLRIKNILGNYNDFLDVGDQKKCFGVSTTPGTPLPQHSKTNPFSIPQSSLTASNTGASSSRHQVAQPPNGQSVSIKRDKGRQSSKHVKSEFGNSAEKPVESTSKPSAGPQPTNILRVNKPPNKAAVKPYKAQKKTSPHKSSSHSKPKLKKPHSSSQLLSEPSLSEAPSNSTTSSHKIKKHTVPPPSALTQDLPSNHSSQPSLPPPKETTNTGTLFHTPLSLKKDALKSEPHADASSKAVKKKKKRRVKEHKSLVVKSEPAQSHDNHVTHGDQEATPTSLKVQLPKQKRPSALQITTSNEDTTMDSESVSSMIQELMMNPLPSTLVTPIPTPVKARPFMFPASQLASLPKAAPQPLPHSRLGSTSSEDEAEERKHTEAMATALSTLDSSLAAESDHTHLHVAPPTQRRPSSSGSDESSSDSSSDSEPEENMLLSLPDTTITPIKQTPPHKLTDHIISPLALDESANLSPAKSKFNAIHATNSMQPSMQQSSLMAPQTSVGFNPVPPERAVDTHLVAKDCEVSDSESSDSSSDSGSESDSESSDSEDQASDIEGKPQSNMARTNLTLSQSSEDALAFDNSGFMDIFAGLDNLQAPSLSSTATLSVFGSDSTQPVTSITSNPSSTVNSSSALPTPIPSTAEDSHGTPLGKRKSTSSQKTARKAPKLTMKEAASTFETHEEKSKKRTISITSSEYHSEEGEVSSEAEDQPTFISQPVSTTANQITPQSYIGTQPHLQLQPSRAKLDTLIVRFPLTDLKRIPDQNKPKATVEPFRQSTESRVRTRPLESDTASDRHDDRGLGRERGEGRGRDGYGSVSGSRHRDEYSRGYHRDRSNDRPRSRGNRWERETSRDRRYPPDDRSGRHMGGRGWGDYEDYWPDDHSDYGSERARRRGYNSGENYPERYMSEARRKKHEADKIQTPGVEKAKAYMESVVLFMKYGGAMEQQSESSSTGAPKKSSAFRTYNETVAMIKYCQNMANDCKPLVILCMRCQSVLLWRMYLIKLPTAAAIQKELQEYFIPPKGAQGKSPYPNSSSPLPSPASVGSTTSTGSGGWTSTQDPSPSGSVTVPKHIVNKATEHLTISNYVNHSVELWKNSEALLYECRDYFVRDDRTTGHRLNHSSSVSSVANWTEKALRNTNFVRYTTY